MAGKKPSSVKFGSVLDKYAQFATKASEMERKPLFSIGPLSLNIAIGNKDGAPMGRLYQLVGKESSGKSTLCLDIIQQYQKAHPDEDVFYIDFERSLDPDYAEACGVDLTRLIRIHPDTTEQGLDIIMEAAESDEVKLFVIDSIAAAMPSSEQGKSMGDNAKMASAASVMSRYNPKIIGPLDNHNATIIMVNQLRKNFSLMSPITEIPWGGMSVQFHVSQTIHLVRTKREEGQQFVTATVQKNKSGAPMQKVDFKIAYGAGIDHADDILNLAEQYGIIQKSGAWYVYGDLKVQGSVRASEQFPIDEIRERIISQL